MSQGIRPMVRSAIIICGVAAALLAPMVAHAMGPAGTWLARMKSPDGSEFEITVKLDGSGTRWNGTLTDPVSGEVPLQNLRVTATRVSFTYRSEDSAIPAHFTGGYIAGDDRITGTFSVRGTSRFVKFERVADGKGFGEVLSASPLMGVRIRHPYRLAVTGRAAYWPAVHLVRDETYKLNDLTKSTLNYDGTLRYYILDGLCVLGRGFRGGYDINEDVKDHADTGVSGDSYLKLDGFEFGVMGFLGNKIMSESKFNPYLTGGLGRVSWAMTEAGRGTGSILLERDLLEGTDWSGFFGLGTEYELSSRFALELEWMWRIIMTADDLKWPDTSGTWSNTHAWSVAAGLTWGFW